MVLQVLAEGPIAADRVEGDQQAGLEQPLGRDRKAPVGGVDAVEDRRERRERRVGQPLDDPQRVVGGDAGVEIDEIRFVRERDGRVLASRKSQLGYFETGKEKGQPYFYIHTTDARSPMSAGAYRIEWSLSDGRSGSSRVVVPTLELADLPRIIEPVRGEAAGDQPTIRWQPPSWITDKPFGRVLVEVRLESHAPRVGQRWATWSEDSELTQIRVGDGGEPPGAHLDAGESYSAAVQYQWRIQYGDLQLGSVARAQREITVGSR